MGWDREFFENKKSVFEKQKEPSGETANKETKFIHCAGCNQPIGSVSTALYEIDEKHYCSECYFRTIANQAVERDHYDLKQEKETLRQT